MTRSGPRWRSMPAAGFYDDPDFIGRYLAIVQGDEGQPLISLLRCHLPDGASVLELGMGPGHDLQALSQHYRVTGSDVSVAFLERYRDEHPDADLLQLDAAKPETDRRWDAVYSNKVLHHLRRAELCDALQRQSQLLRAGGLLLHSFWVGDGDNEQIFEGMTFTYYDEAALRLQVEPAFEILALEVYGEMEPDDSLMVLCRKRSHR